MSHLSLYDFRVTTQDPLPHAANADQSGVFTVSFNYPVNINSATYEVITYTKIATADDFNPTPVEFDISFSSDSMTMILTPSAVLDPGGEYMVVIRGSDDPDSPSLKNKLGHNLRWTFTSSFITGEITISRPTLSAPSDASSTKAPITLSWAESVVTVCNTELDTCVELEPTRYEICVATDTAFTTKVYDAYTTDTNVIIGVVLQENVDYFWKVRAQYEKEVEGEDNVWYASQWSDVFQFYLGFIIPGESFTEALGETLEAIYTIPDYTISIANDSVFAPTNSSDPIVIEFENDIDIDSVSDTDISLTYRVLPFHRGRPESLSFTTDITHNQLTISGINGGMGWRENLIYTLTLTGILDTEGNPLIDGTDTYTFVYNLDPLYFDWVYVSGYIQEIFSIANIDLAKITYSLMIWVTEQYANYYGGAEIPSSFDRWIECFILYGALADIAERILSDQSQLSSDFTLGDLTIRDGASSNLPELLNKYEREANMCLSRIIPNIRYAVKAYYRILPASLADSSRSSYIPSGRLGWPAKTPWL